MYHSITFGDGTLNSKGQFTGTNTWDDWYLIPTSRPNVASPGVSTNLVEIPGRHGSLDMSEWLTNGIVYGDRSGSWEFAVDNDHEGWVSIKSKILKFLHGQRMKCVLEDDPGWYYIGRFSLNEWRSESWYSTIVINYVLEPYKYNINAGGDWLWDPFNFETDRTDTVTSEKRL